ncbi:PepSY-like domain-containing protein [Winogradskyella sp. PC D3.3]
MKTIINLPLFAIVTLFAFFTSCSSDDDNNSNEIILSEEEIPEAIQTYIATHFSSNSIVLAEQETEGNTVTYDIYLSGNIALEFNNSFAIIDIDSATQLPDSVIPEDILNYVATNYPTNFITDWELELNYQQVELDNHIELEFDMNGDFIRIDND